MISVCIILTWSAPYMGSRSVGSMADLVFQEGNDIYLMGWDGWVDGWMGGWMGEWMDEWWMEGMGR